MFTKFTYILNINNVEIFLHISYIIVEYFYKLKSDTKINEFKSLQTIFVETVFNLFYVISFS